jgi:Ni/Co efflux regulator RcnB
MRTRWLYAAAVALLGLTGGEALAQGRGHGRGHDRGGRPETRGQERREDRAAEARFGDRDRVYARNWYYHNRRDLPPGLRDRDRLPPPFEARFRPGYVIEPEWRARIYPAPVVLVRTFAPPPPGYRYVVFGGHLVLVDDGYRVRDVLSLDIHLGP